MKEHAVYPGHPITLACQIASEYESLAEATKPTKYGWSDALSNDAINGAGGSVCTALEALHKLARGEPLDSVLEWAAASWRWTCANDIKQDPARGQEQANRMLAQVDLVSWIGVDEPRSR